MCSFLKIVNLIILRKNYSENLFKVMGDLLVSEGYLAVGYDFISLDDCWSSKQRTVDGRLQADPLRFPSGMKSLGDYVR